MPKPEENPAQESDAAANDGPQLGQQEKRDAHLPFKPLFRNDHFSDDLWIAANFAIAFAWSARHLSSTWFWIESDPRRIPINAGCIAESARFISKLALKCQDSIRVISHELTAVRTQGPCSVDKFVEENAHWVAYRIGIDALYRLVRCLPSGLGELHDLDNAELARQIVDHWDACKAAMTVDVPARLVESQVIWEATRVESERARQEILIGHNEALSNFDGALKTRYEESQLINDDDLHEDERTALQTNFGMTDDAATTSQLTSQPEKAADDQKERWTFVKSGDGYYISALGVEGHFSAMHGFNHLFKLVSMPTRPIPMSTLIQTCAASTSRSLVSEAEMNDTTPEGFGKGSLIEDVIDQEARDDIQRKMSELNEEIEEARRNNDFARQEKLKEEQTQLTDYLASNLRLGGRKRSASTEVDKFRSRIHSNLNRAYEKLRGANPPMEQLATHFKKAISSTGGTFCYHPEMIPNWQLHK
jgi:ElaB/YqjD/DUF883 family membrane-anchored ribosome-binding protein